MATAKEILAVARSELGYREDPPGTNLTKYGKWFGLNGNPWCMMFIQWVFFQAGAYELLPAHTGSCGAFMRAAQAQGRWIIDGYRPGDIVIYNFPGNNVLTDHCGIVVTALTTGIRAIEGNTGAESDANGGQVQERTRPTKFILGAHRPDYDEEEEMFDISKLTDQEVMQLAERMQAVLASRAVSSALAAEVEEAKALGITDGSRPSAFCTRAQCAAMVKRAVNRT